jgi:FecR protein
MNTDDLIHHYLDGTATKAETDQLSHLIETDVITRDRYLALAELHAALSADESLLQIPQIPQIKHEPRPHGHLPGPWLKIAAALALLASGVWWFFSSPGMTPPMVKLISSINAQWANENTALSLNAGDAPVGLLSLIEGTAEFVTVHGASVTLEGPVVMRFEDATEIFVESGKIVCRCPTPESRVTVRTPQTQVVDLGTEFAVEARVDSSTRVAVLSGEVRVGADARGRVLHQGEAAEVRSPGMTMLRTEVVQEMVPHLPTPENAPENLNNLLRNPGFDPVSGDFWSLMDDRVRLTDSALRISSRSHRYWPNARQAVWLSDLPGRVVTASVRAKQPSADPLQPMQFAVLKIIFLGDKGRTLAYASRHFQFGGEAPDVFQKATLTAAAPPGTKGVSLELLLNARGEDRGTLIFDDAALTIEP